MERDNEALNELAGMTQCFVKEGYCRMSYCTVEEGRYMITEDMLKLRAVEVYKKDITLNNFKTSGVRKKCVFNELSKVHIISCPSVDIMHEVLLGVCHSQMTEIISYFLEN